MNTSNTLPRATTVSRKSLTVIPKWILSKSAYLSLILATSTSLIGATWDGGGADNEYSTAFNWDDDLVPTSATDSTQDISGAFTVERNVNSTSGRTFVDNGAVLNVTAGAHDDSWPGNTIRNFIGDGSSGTVNLGGASTTYEIGHVLAIARSSNSNGSFFQTDGALSVYRGGNSLIGGYGGIFSRGHSISIGGNSGHSNVSGLYEISGGSLNTRVGVAVGNGGIFSVVGSSATEIRLGGSGDDTGWFALSADGTLKAAIDAGGITPIFIEDRTNTSTVTPEVELQAGSLLDLDFVNSPTDGTWTLLEVENANINDSGHALAPSVPSNWSFSIDNTGANGLLTVSYQAVAPTDVFVSSIAELVPYLDDDNINLVMTPGTYQIGPADVTSGLLGDGDRTLIKFSGNNSTFDFTGVTFEYDTYVYRSMGSVDMRSIEVAGEDLVLKNLTSVDIGTARPGKTALAVYLNGRRNLVEGFTMTLRGSIPYGYGDIFGKGSGSVIGHKKHSAVLIGGDNNTLRGATIYHRAYGHGIFVQGAINTLIEDCYVEGELSTTDEVLAEFGTGSRADDVAFQTVWGFPLRAGNTFSLQEDGIRAYNTGPDPEGVTRNTANLEVRNCTVYRMRSGVTIGFTNGIQLVENCVAIQCENAYWIQNGDIDNSAADSQVGIVLASPYGNSGTKNVDVTIVKNDNEGGEHNRMLAYIAGHNDNITFRSSAANTSVNQNIKLVVGGPRDSYRYELTDTGLNATTGVINNLTNYPIDLSSSSSTISGSSWGAVTDNGSSNSVTSTTHSTLGGYAMMQTIQAEDYTSESGTTQLSASIGGVSVGDIQDGDWLRFDDVFFGSGPKYMEAHVAGGVNGGSIEVRLDSAAGTLLGTLNVSASATSGNWITESAAITHTQGKQDVYLVFTGGAGDLFELNSFRFTERGNDPFARDADHLIAHYKFDDGAGTVATDSSGNGYDGTISNATWVSGVEQSALSFNGSNSTVDIPATLYSHMDEEITISLWVYGDATQPSTDSVLYAQAAGGERILNVHLPYSDSTVYWDSGDTGGYDRATRLATASQYEGQWNHWTFVKSTTDSDSLIYHNGVLFAAEQGDTKEIGDAVIASIGSRLGGNNYFGLIDEVKIYNVALSKVEIKEQYEDYLIIDTYTLSYTAGANGSITGSSAQLVDEDSDGTAVTAVADANYSFVDWSDGSTDNPRTDLSVTADIAVAANFTIDTYTMTYTAGANGSLTGDASQTIDHGSDATFIEAVPAANYHFVDWSDGSTDNPRTDTNVTAVINVTANFTIDTYTLTYTAGANGSITGTSSQIVDHGSDGSAVSAVAVANYSFVNWSDSSTDNPRTDLSVTGDVNVTANFIAANTELENWRFTNFGTYSNTGVAADDFDADFDGVVNLIEYATGTDPNTSGVASFTIQSSGAGLEVSFDRIVDPSLNYVVEGTDNPVSAIWTPIWSGTGASAGEVVVPDTLWPSGVRYFLRLSVSD